MIVAVGRKEGPTTLCSLSQVRIGLAACDVRDMITPPFELNKVHMPASETLQWAEGAACDPLAFSCRKRNFVRVLVH